MQAVIDKNGGSIPVCTERKATGEYVLASVLPVCDNDLLVQSIGSMKRDIVLNLSFPNIPVDLIVCLLRYPPFSLKTKKNVIKSV